MELHEFRDTLKRLSFVDRQPWMSDAEWYNFLEKPERFFTRAHSETAEKLWNIIRPIDGKS